MLTEERRAREKSVGVLGGFRARTCKTRRPERADDRRRGWCGASQITSSYDRFFSERLERMLCRKKVQTSIKENNLRKLRVNICHEKKKKKTTKKDISRFPSIRRRLFFPSSK